MKFGLILKYLTVLKLLQFCTLVCYLYGFLSKNINSDIYGTMTLPAGCYGYEIWCFAGQTVADIKGICEKNVQRNF